MFSKPVTNIISRSNPRPNPIVESYGVLAVRYVKGQVGMEKEGMEKKHVKRGVDRGEEKRGDEKEDEKKIRQKSVVEEEEEEEQRMEIKGCNV